MGFWEELNESFLAGFKAGPAPSWLGGLRVKRTPSPITVRALSQQQAWVADALVYRHRQLLEEYGATPDRCLLEVVSDTEAHTYFSELAIADPKARYLYLPWLDLVRAMARAEPMLQPVTVVEVAPLASAERLKLHERLVFLERFIAAPTTYLDAWSNHLFAFASYTMEQLAEAIQTAPTDTDLALACPLIDCLPNPHEYLAMLLRHFAGCDAVPVVDLGLYTACQEQLFAAVLKASGLKLEDLAKKEPDTPLNHQTVPASALVPLFLGNTPFVKLLLTPVPYGL